MLAVVVLADPLVHRWFESKVRTSLCSRTHPRPKASQRIKSAQERPRTVSRRRPDYNECQAGDHGAHRGITQQPRRFRFDHAQSELCRYAAALVAVRIERAAQAIGDPARVLAGTDCGFETTAGFTAVVEDVVWARLRALAEGARIASALLF